MTRRQARIILRELGWKQGKVISNGLEAWFSPGPVERDGHVAFLGLAIYAVRPHRDSPLATWSHRKINHTNAATAIDIHVKGFCP